MEATGVMPVYEMNKNEGMSGGMGWYWVFFLFFLLAWGGNGFGFGNHGANQINNDFLYTNLKNTVDNGFTQVANQNFGIQKDLCQGFGGVQQGLANLGYQQQNCCCEQLRAIDAVRADAYKNTCEITNAIHAEGEATRALMTQNTIQELRDQLQAAQLQLGNMSQTNTLTNILRPFPQPSYITCSPYQSVGNCGAYVGCNC